jgi:hypothetical protein
MAKRKGVVAAADGQVHADVSKPVVGKISMIKDPRVYAATVPKCWPPYKRILGLDLGTNMGVSYVDIIPGVPITSAKIVVGQWDLSIGPYDSGPVRHIRLKQFLAVVAPDLVFFENVKFSPPAAIMARGVGAVLARVATAAEFLGSLKCTLTTWCEERQIPVEGIAIKEIKRYATGRGNCGKEEMIAAANARFGTTLAVEDYEQTGADNMADSLFVCDMALSRYSEGLTDTPTDSASRPESDVVKSENHDD